MRNRLPYAALLFMLVAAPAAAQVKVKTLAQGGKKLAQSTAVQLSRLDGTKTQTLKVGDVLSEGDRLTALALDLVVELTCPQGKGMRFTGSFEAVINPPKAANCAYNNRIGGRVVVMDPPKKVTNGSTTMGEPASADTDEEIVEDPPPLSRRSWLPVP